MKIKFGDLVQDEITGFTGVVVAKADWMYVTYPKFAVQAKQLGQFPPLFTEWFDEPRLKKITKKILKKKELPEEGVKVKKTRKTRKKKELANG